MTPPTSSTQITTELERALDELDRLIHRSKALLRPAPMYNAWEAGRGLLKGKIVEDPLAYQKRIRGEEEV